MGLAENNEIQNCIRKTNILAVDGMRGVAVLMVVMFHCRIRPGASDGHVVRVAAALVDLGRAGVDLFFLLSGFLITGILLDAIGRPHYFRNFYARRALRIFPIYFLALGLVALGVFFLPDLFPPEAFPIREAAPWLLTYTFNIGAAFFAVPKGSFIHFWSLCIEAHFYLVWPLVVCFMRGWKFVALVVTVGIGSVVLRGVLISYQLDYWPSYAFTLSHLEGLMLGAVCAYSLRTCYAALLNTFLSVGVLLSAVMLCGIAVYFRRFSFFLPPVAVEGYACLNVIFAYLLYTVVRAPEGRLAHLFSNPILRWFGFYSYSIYVIHHLLLGLIPRYANLGKLTSNWWLLQTSFTVVVVAGSSLCASLAWHLVEKHAMALKKHF